MNISYYEPGTAIATDPQQPWTPNLFGKQWDIFNCRKLMLLISGSRNAAKSHAALHKIWRHLWETPGARFAVIAKSKGLAKGGGSWEQLTTHIAEEWLQSEMVGITDLPIAYTTKNGEGTYGPKEAANTRTPYFKIRNYYGGESECMLLSVDHDHEVGTKLKNKYFSGVYFVELSMFKDPKILSTSLQCLRLPHLKTPEGVPNPWFMWMADTNPDEDLGNRSWFYKIFYVDRNKSEWFQEHEIPDPIERQKKNEDAAFHYGSMEVIEMFYQDNPYCSRQEAITLEMSCDGDPALYDSWVLGKHGDAGKKRNKLFAGVFMKELHVIGGEPSGQIDVHGLSTSLISGWDMGGVNHAGVLLDKWPMNIRGRELSGFSVLDELVYIGKQLMIGDFGIEMHQKMIELDQINQRPYSWTHWSDSNAIDTFRPSSGTFDYMEIRFATNGAINLQGVTKPPVKTRISLLRRLIHQGRLFVSARCHHVIKMLLEAKAGEDSDKDPFDESDNLKHIFDALTYPLFMECFMELVEASSNKPKARENQITNSQARSIMLL